MTFDRPASYAYPADLAAHVHDAWSSIAPNTEPLDRALLEEVFSTAYQASLMLEEGRAVIFRLLLCPPDVLPVEAGPPTGLHRIRFDQPRPFDAHELRRLALASPYHRALMGVCAGHGGKPTVWGIVYSGSRWLRVQTGGRIAAPPLPAALVVGVSETGRLEIGFGDRSVGLLEGGRIGGSGLDIFSSRWLPERFAPERRELMALHEKAREKEGPYWAPLDESLIVGVAQHMLKQLIAIVRASHHGGTLLLLPPDLAAEACAPNPILQLKYRLRQEEARGRYRSIVLNTMRRLADLYGGPIAPRPVGWDDFRRSRNETVAALDEAMFEVSHLIAGLAGVDGAVVMDRRFEILGFAAEIGGSLPDAPSVARATDLEGTTFVEESTERVGTRHRSAYRLCNAVPEAVAIVVSQDGGVRFVTRRNGRVTYWDYLPAGFETV